MRISRISMVAFTVMAAAIATSAQSLVTISIEAPRVASSTVTGYNLGVDNLNSSANGLPTVNFSGTSITGTTTGFVNIGGANVYGGAGGTGSFGTVVGSASIQLSSAVNYFGLWGSALDGQNTVALYSGDNLLGSYALQSILEASPGFNAAYKGNPFISGNTGEEYAFFNFMSNVAFNRIDLIQNNGGGFEFDNLTVGTVVSAAPEAATWAMMLVGFGAIGWATRSRKRIGAVAFA